MKLLFVCSRNRRRSLTAERVFAQLPGVQVRSAGTAEGARVRVTAGHLGWADSIFVMEKRHLAQLRAKFGADLVGRQIVCLHIPDDYEYMDEALVARLEQAVAPYLPAAEADDEPPEDDVDRG